MHLRYCVRPLLAYLLIGVAIDPRAEVNTRQAAMKLIAWWQLPVDSAVGVLLRCSTTPELQQDLRRVLRWCIQPKSVYSELSRISFREIDVVFALGLLSAIEPDAPEGPDRQMKQFLYRVISKDSTHAPDAIQVFMRFRDLSLLDTVVLYWLTVTAGANNDLACAAIEVLARRTRPTLLLATYLIQRAARPMINDSPSAVLKLLHSVPEMEGFRELCLRHIDYRPMLESRNDLVVCSTLQILYHDRLSASDNYLAHFIILSFHKDPIIRRMACSLTLMAATRLIDRPRVLLRSGWRALLNYLPPASLKPKGSDTTSRHGVCVLAV